MKKLAYHGSFSGSLNNEEGKYLFTGDIAEAKDMAKVAAKKNGGTPVVYHCEISLDKPYTNKDLWNAIGDKHYREVFKETGGKGKEIFDTNCKYITDNIHTCGQDSICFTNDGKDLFIATFSADAITIKSEIPVDSTRDLQFDRLLEALKEHDEVFIEAVKQGYDILFT